MKFFQYITATILVASLMTSCQPTFEEQLEGTWVIHEVTITGDGPVPGTNSRLLFNGENNASTLEIEILDDYTADLSGILSASTVSTMDGEEIMTFDIDHQYNESRTWQVLEDDIFELVGSEDFDQGKLVDDKLIFELNEMTDEGTDELFNLEGVNLVAEIIFVKQ